jgi:AraC-like DNA-binding protein
VDDDWKVYSYFQGSELVDAKGNLHLPLVGLKPGNYTVEVQASMFPDSWEGTVPYVWEIHVNQPWWQATGVYVLIVLVILVVLLINLVLFGKNTKMRARRNTEESDIVRKIQSFVERCDAYGNELLAPTEEDLYSKKYDAATKLSQEFISLMLLIVPFVREKMGNFTMREIAEAGNVDIVKLYDLMTANLYKSPRELARIVRIQKAADLLLSTDLTVEEISTQCGFHTPNYFMGCFFHEYKMTPKEFRKEKKN